jgi:hypothetical protein
VRYLLPIWLILITGLSLAPFRVKYHLGATGMWHSMDHVAIFLVTTILVCYGAADTWTRMGRSCALLVFAILCEWLELAVYGNFRFEWHDVLIDWSGIVLGFAVSAITNRLFEARKRLAR